MIIAFVLWCGYNSSGMPTPGPTHVSALDEPLPQREAVLEAIALEAATGSSVAQLAARFGYSYNGMYTLTKRAEFVARRDYFQKRLEDERFTAQRKLLLHLPEMMDAHLAIAVPKDDSGNLILAQSLTKQSMQAREYLIDKVLPTTTRTEQVSQQVNAPETIEVLTELRTVLRRINDERSGRTTLDIEASPHVYEGVEALPSPLLKLPSGE